MKSSPLSISDGIKQSEKEKEEKAVSVGVARFRRLFDSICGISQRRVGVKEEQRIFGIDSLR